MQAVRPWWPSSTCREGSDMFSRKLTKVTVFTLTLSAGAVFVAPAGAAQSRDVRGRAGSSRQEVWSPGAAFAGLLALWATPWGSRQPNPPGSASPQFLKNRDEGPGICPVGQQGPWWRRCPHKDDDPGGH